MRRTLTLVAALVFLAGFAPLAWAANFRYETAMLKWDWDQGDGPPADGFIAKGGPALGNYPYTVTIADPAARQVLIKTFVPIKGDLWFVVYAYNIDEVSGPSNIATGHLIGPLRATFNIHLE